MAQFGQDATGSASSSSGNLITGTVYNLSEAGLVESITVRREAGGTVTAKCAIYKYSDSTLVAQTEEKTANSGVNTFNFLPPVTLAAGDYWLLFWDDDISGANWHFYSTSFSGQFSMEDLNTYGTWPDPLPAYTNLSTRKYRIYATYTSLKVRLLNPNKLRPAIFTPGRAR